jgi:hypothetical protein
MNKVEQGQIKWDDAEIFLPLEDPSLHICFKFRLVMQELEWRLSLHSETLRATHLKSTPCRAHHAHQGTW